MSLISYSIYQGMEALFQVAPFIMMQNARFEWWIAWHFKQQDHHYSWHFHWVLSNYSMGSYSWFKQNENGKYLCIIFSFWTVGQISIFKWHSRMRYEANVLIIITDSMMPVTNHVRKFQKQFIITYDRQRVPTYN